jgi:hypothetical protein
MVLGRERIIAYEYTQSTSLPYQWQMRPMAGRSTDGNFKRQIRALIERVIHYERSRLILLAAACWAVATITCVPLGVHLWSRRPTLKAVHLCLAERLPIVEIEVD